MATGIVYGRIVHPSGDPAVAVRVVLDYIFETTTSYAMRRGGLEIEPRTPRDNCAPYGVCADTNEDGRYVLIYDWRGTHIDAQLMQCRFRIKCFDLSALEPSLGNAVRMGGVVGLDLRSLISQLLPLDAFAGGQDSVTIWLNLIADEMRPLQGTSGIVRGMLGDPLSTELALIATRLDLTARR